MSYLATIIIPHFNGEEIISCVFEHLCDQSIKRDDYQIIIIDDYSSSPINELSILCEKYHIHLIKSNKRIGVSSCRNIGLQFCESSQYILFLGQDIVVPRNFIESHINFIENNGITVSLGEIIFPDEYTAKSNFMVWLENTPYQFDYLKVRKDGATWRNFYTSNIAISKILIDNHYFDPEFKYLFEDLDFGYRLYKKTGIQPVFNPNAVVQHYHWRTIYEFISRQYKAGREAYRFAQKHNNLTGSENDFCVQEILHKNEYEESDYKKALNEINICNKIGSTPQSKTYEIVLRYRYAKGVKDAHEYFKRNINCTDF